MSKSPGPEMGKSARTADVTMSRPQKAEKRDAFTELLSPKNKQQKSKAPHTWYDYMQSEKRAPGGPRDALGAYIKDPESFSSNVVVYHNKNFVAIHDRYPKSTLHLLLLPRDLSKTRLHPFDAFDDPEFLDKVRMEVKKIRALVAAELRRMYGKESAQEKRRYDALDADPPPDELPSGRDWEKEIMCGIHSGPSMNHLHIHVMSVDRYSERMKSKKHYNSFSTPFFVDIADFPLPKNDPRRHFRKLGYLQSDYICWRCGRNFGNKFAELKGHLEKEFNEWKRQ
ncbi:hypothetical protein SI65_04548 [Aspergillus cristatus]|uniref:Aprataxin-like protein n=1 Tax=Aspergillus cristatus TaxID=573508 RepID=A0A1E3BF29_ASPCR|nr:hypothetical protein SI65_04548 [Aspergillus cristatus]